MKKKNLDDFHCVFPKRLYYYDFELQDYKQPKTHLANHIFNNKSE